MVLSLYRKKNHTEKGYIKHYQDSKCIVWCISASRLNISSEDSPDDVSHYVDFENTLNSKNISFPMPSQQAESIEEQNNYR